MQKLLGKLELLKKTVGFFHCRLQQVMNPLAESSLTTFATAYPSFHS
jgi:hypothetical protein